MEIRIGLERSNRESGSYQSFDKIPGEEESIYSVSEKQNKAF